MKEKRVTTTEARKNIASITNDVENNNLIYAFTKHGKVVAKLLPVEVADQTRIDPNFTEDLKGFLSEYGKAMGVLAKK